MAKNVYSEDLLEKVSCSILGHTGKPFFQSLTQSMAEVLEVDCAFVGQLLPPGQVHTVSYYAHHQFLDNITYALAATPCEKVLEGDFMCFPKKVQPSFRKTITWSTWE